MSNGDTTLSKDPKEPIKRTPKEEWQDFKKNPTNFLSHNRPSLVIEGVVICKVLGVMLGVEFF